MRTGDCLTRNGDLVRNNKNVEENKVAVCLFVVSFERENQYARYTKAYAVNLNQEFREGETSRWVYAPELQLVPHCSMLL